MFKPNSALAKMFDLKPWQKSLAQRNFPWDRCPIACDDTGGSWSVYNNVKRVEACDKHMLLDFALHNPLDDPSMTVKIRACTLSDEVPRVSRRLAGRDTDAESDVLCVAGASSIDVSLDVASYLSGSYDLSQVFSYTTGLIIGVFAGAAIDNRSSASAVLVEVINLINNTAAGAPETIFAQRCVSKRSSKHTFGIAINNACDLSWVQSAVQSWSNGLCLNASALTSAETSEIANTTIYEYTHPSVTLYNITVVHSISDSITASLTSSSSGSSGASASAGLSSSDLETTSASSLSTGTSTSTSTGSSTAAAATPPGPTQTGIVSTYNAYAIPTSGQGYEWNPAIRDCENFWADEAYCVGVSSAEKRDGQVFPVRSPFRRNWKRDECSTIQIYSGDTCESPATECGISLDNFTSYNGDTCDSPLTPGQHVCCSDGDLPDFTPQMYDNGTCYTYLVVFGDSCSEIGAANSLINTEIEEFNNGTTWGWTGCNNLFADSKICLRDGDPPLPNTVANAECGPIIPGIPAGQDTDGYYYFQFISIVRGYLGLDTDKTISMAAPASYWYLKNFKIYKSALECDYVVYMTYDLHGKASNPITAPDYLNSWSQDGCEGGNCLRSHVNLTETYYALSMITKAGVASYLITVGVSSYGRSFKMAEAGCTGPEYFYLANSDNSSLAAPGECTATAGYIANAEILDIIYSNATGTDSWYDEDTDTDYLVYNDTEWVAYMSDEVKASRTALWNSYNFRGTVDWAIDLIEFLDDDDNPDGDCESGEYDDDGNCEGYGYYEGMMEWTACDDGPFDFDDLTDDVIDSWPSWCAAEYILSALQSLLDTTLSDYTDMINNDYDDKFETYTESVADSASSQVYSFMEDNGNNYFTCHIAEMSTCCDFCDDCNYCFASSVCYNMVNQLDGLHTTQQKTLITKWKNITEPCPPDLSERGLGDDQSIWWSLNEDKSEALYEDLLNARGIP
ncbi:glycoside hydrolase family 18 protein [Seiridium cupressi]